MLIVRGILSASCVSLGDDVRDNDPLVSMVFDPTKLRPASSDLQAVAGCSAHHVHLFDIRTWLHVLNDKMVVISEPLSWWQRVALGVNRNLINAN